jgi:hypothetical protein
MYRGQTCFLGKTLTTPLLLSYKKSLETMLEAAPQRQLKKFSAQGGYIKGFTAWYKNQLKENSEKTGENDLDKALLYSCLPLAAWENKKNHFSEKKPGLFSALKLVNSAPARYNVTE